MASVELIMPKMGESIMEATILKWLKKEGDTVEEDETVLEISTDKVDSEVPAPVSGVMGKILYNEGDTVPVGEAIALINAEGETGTESPVAAAEEVATAAVSTEKVSTGSQPSTTASVAKSKTAVELEHQKPLSGNGNGRFYSPLVLNIARTENIPMSELEAIRGTGLNQRVTKKDILNYLQQRKEEKTIAKIQTQTVKPPTSETKSAVSGKPVSTTASGNVEIVEMDRMRKLIAEHMVRSKHTSAHVTSFVEVDVSKMVHWRNRVKEDFLKREGEKLTYTPLFIEAIVQAIKEYPMLNSSVDGDKIIIKKDINIGMATALPSGNLIVPVIKNTGQLNLTGITKHVNDLANRARNNKLKPEEVEGGTFTISNVGTFGNLMGTPIINQPQVAVLATGSIKKKPVVIESEYGDMIAIRHMMFLSLSYDHRIIDGYLGGTFLRRLADIIEAFDENRIL